MKNIDNLINSIIKEFLNEDINKNKKEEIQTLIDIISMNPSKYQKYVDLLKDKYNIDYYKIDKDNEYIENANLNDIKSKNDFLNFNNYIKYAKKIFGLRNIPLQKNIDKEINANTIKEIGEKLGFKTKIKEYSGNGNYAAFDLVDTIIVPQKVDVNTLIHEIGHFFDHKYSNNYQGLAKTITHASSSYGISKSNEVFAENFLHFFIAPNMLKEKLPNVYEELNEKIPEKFKILIYNLLNKK